VAERAEEIGEVAIARIVPVELHAVAHDHPGRGARARFVQRGEQDVQRRISIVGHHLARTREQDRAKRGVAREEAGARRGRERNRRHELRVIAAAVTAICVRPRPVEHVLAVRMRLRVERQRAGEQAVVPCGEIAWRPAGTRGRAAGRVQRRQERVREQRLSGRERVPRGRCDRFERHVGAHVARGCAASMESASDVTHRYAAILARATRAVA
jgi:hypothetical protein